MTKSEGSLPREIVQGLVEKLEGYKPLVVLVEGMDNSGKTTLIRRLERMLCLEYIHSVYEPTEEGQAKFIEGVFTQIDVIAGPNHKKTGVVLDRISLVSELVYGPILRHGSVLQPRTHQRLLDKLWTYDPIIIYCRPTTETIISNIHEREQMAGVAEKAAELVVQYDNVMSSILSGSRGVSTDVLPVRLYPGPTG